jgi:hypothetical protein
VKPKTDTSLAARPVFTTDAGRKVRGGGGIVPDVIVKQDTLTAGERELVKAFGEHIVYAKAFNNRQIEIDTSVKKIDEYKSRK